MQDIVNGILDGEPVAVAFITYIEDYHESHMLVLYHLQAGKPKYSGFYRIEELGKTYKISIENNGVILDLWQDVTRILKRIVLRT